jgi:hypothetical protein
VRTIVDALVIVAPLALILILLAMIFLGGQQAGVVIP